jgi:maltose alpha-D-glucosyltransferase / alpha-amylase
MLDTFILEKAVYELNYELNNRPDWVSIPIKGIKYIMQSKSEQIKEEPMSNNNPNKRKKVL